MSTLTISTFQLNPQAHFNGSTCWLRITYSAEFIASDGTTVLGSPNYYSQIQCTISSGIITVPSFSMYCTSNSQTTQNVTVTGVIYDQSFTRQNTLWSQWTVPQSMSPSATYAQWSVYNAAPTLSQPIWQYLNRDQTIALIQSYIGTNAFATTTVAGITRLDVAPVTSTIPIAVGSNSPLVLGKVSTGLTLTAGTGLSGGGDLTTNRTFALASTTVTPGTYNFATVTVNQQGQITGASNGTVNSGTVTSISTGTGLSGGPITTSGTISLAASGVTAGSYTNANITVDAFGRATSVSNGSGGGGSGTVTSITASGGITSGGAPITATGTLQAEEQVNATLGTTPYTIVVADRGKLLVGSAISPFIIGFTPSVLQSAFFCDVKNQGTDILYVQPSAGTINGAANVALNPGEGGRMVVQDNTHCYFLRTSGVSSSPGGSNTQIQFNNSGTFTGIPFATSDGVHLFATAPRITDTIDDTNGKAILGLIPQPGSTQYLTIDNNGPTLSVDGSGSNINMRITPKGTGNVIIYGNKVLSFGGLTLSGNPGLTNSGTSLLATLGDLSDTCGFIAKNIQAYNGYIAGKIGQTGLISMYCPDATGPITVQAPSTGTTYSITLPGAVAASTSVLLSDNTGVTSWSAAWKLPEVTDTFSATPTFNLANGVSRHITLTGNVTSSTWSGLVAGMDVTMTVIQGSGGSHTVAWPTNTKWVGGTPPTLTTAVGAVDIVTFHSYDGVSLFQTSVSLNIH